MKEFIIANNEEGQRLNKYLKKILPNASDSFLYKMLRKKNIKLNDKKAEGNEIVSVGDKINIYFSDETFNNFALSNKNCDNYNKAYLSLKNINIVFEDNDMIIFNKPKGILSQKSNDSDLSINDYLIGYLINKKEYDFNSDLYTPSIINRLDRNTEGLIICAKTLKASQILSKLIKERKIKKYYKAKCHGLIDRPLKLEDYLIKDAKSNTVKIVNSKSDNAIKIITKVFPIAYDKNNDISTIKIDLITGKTHQIRAHLASINHPLVGDPKYGNLKNNRDNNIHFQELCAYRLEFPSECDNLKWSNLIIEI